MDVAGALGIQKCRVHLLHVDTAIGQFRMAIRAGLPRALAVLLMARQAAQSFVHSHRAAIVPTAGLHRRERRMALVTKSLPLVGTGADGTAAVVNDGKRQDGGCYMHARTAV